MSDDATPRVFEGEDLSRAQFRECDLSGAQFRAVDIAGGEIEAPYLLEGGNSLYVNGIDVVPLIDAELNRRHPGRELRYADTPEALATAWQPMVQAWEALIARAVAMPAGTVDRSVGGEWSFSQTLRHLIFATDAWLGKAVLAEPEPFHPLGQGCDDVWSVREGSAQPRYDAPFDAVLAAWRGRMAKVADFIERATPELLAEDRPNPYDPEQHQSVLRSVRVPLREGWEHLRYATRDLDAIESGHAGTATS